MNITINTYLPYSLIIIDSEKQVPSKIKENVTLHLDDDDYNSILYLSDIILNYIPLFHSWKMV